MAQGGRVPTHPTAERLDGHRYRSWRVGGWLLLLIHLSWAFAACAHSPHPLLEQQGHALATASLLAPTAEAAENGPGVGIDFAADRVGIGAHGELWVEKLSLTTPTAPEAPWLRAERLQWQTGSLYFEGVSAGQGGQGFAAEQLWVEHAGAWRAVNVRWHDADFSATAASLWRQEEHLQVRGLRARPCPCGDGDGDGIVVHIAEVVLPLQAHPGEAPFDAASAATARLEGVAVEALGMLVRLPVYGLHPDGRASGVLAPRIGYSASRGWSLWWPLFFRLGSAADLGLAPGWLSAVGPALAIEERHVGAAGRGHLEAELRYDLDAAELALDSQGWAPWELAPGLRLLAAIDFSTTPATPWPAFSDFATRTRGFGQSAVAVSYESPTWAADLGADFIQDRWRPRWAETLSPAARPAAVDTARWPWVRMRSHQRPAPWLRWELEAGMTHFSSGDGAAFIDWGEGGLAPWALQGERPLGAGDGHRDAGEPWASGLAMQVRSVLRWPVALGSLARLDLATEAWHETVLGDSGRLRENQTRLALGAELGTTLARRYAPGTHLLRPVVRWRWEVADFRRPARSSSVWSWDVAPRIGHSLEGGFGSQWLGANWAWQAEMGAVLALPGPGEVEGSASFLRTQVGWDDSPLSLGGDLVWSHGGSDSLAGGAWIAWRPDALWRLVAAYHRMGRWLLWSGRPGAHEVATAWRMPEVTPSDMLALALQGALGPTIAGADAAWVLGAWPGLDVSAFWDYVAGCGCWRVGLRGAWHVDAPRWELGLRLSVGPSP